MLVSHVGVETFLIGVNIRAVRTDEFFLIFEEWRNRTMILEIMFQKHSRTSIVMTYSKKQNNLSILIF